MEEKIDKLYKKMEDMEKSLGKKYDEIRSNIKTTIDNQEILNQSLKKLQKENKVYRNEILELKDRVEYLERSKLETTMNLYPVIETEKMDLKEVVQKIGKKTGIKLEGRDIVDIFRRPKKKSGKPGDIVIKFINKEIRDKVLEGIRKVRLTHDDIGIKCEIGRIYGNEELTRLGKDIYYKALKLKYEEKWKFLWIKGGKTYIKKEESGRAIRLDNLETIEELCRNT